MNQIKGEDTLVSFTYKDSNGQPISGASLTAWVRGVAGPSRDDRGQWTVTQYSPSEFNPAVAPGVYDLRLTASEMNYDLVQWYARSSSGVYAGNGEIRTSPDEGLTRDLILNTVYGEPTDSDEQELICDFLDRLADHVLRRSQASAEVSSHGDTVSLGSLLGVTGLLTQGQMVATGCNGDSYIFVNSARQGQPPLGALRVVNNSQGVPVGVLPLTGPNAISDATQNCECP